MGWGAVDVERERVALCGQRNAGLGTGATASARPPRAARPRLLLGFGREIDYPPRMVMNLDVATPQPAGCVALLIMLPGLWIAGIAAARRLGLDRATGRLVGPALSLSLWLCAVHAIAYAARAFLPGLVVGTILVGAGGYSAAWRGEARAPAGPAPSRGRVALAALAALVIAPMALRWSFHDEATIAGHMAFVGEMQNGFYPPGHLVFPDVELRYHYGFDVVVAAVTAVTRLRIDRAMDAVTLAAFAWTAALAWRLGDVWNGPTRGAGPLTALLLLFGGGAPLLCAPSLPPSVPTLLGQCSIEGLSINPPFVSYFFQHPWTLGAPLALAALLVAAESRRRAPRLAALGLLLLALSFVQIVLFLTLGGALLAAESLPWIGWGKSDLRSSVRRGLALLILLVVVLLVASRFGGFFAPAPDGATSSIEAHRGIVETLAGNVRWHLASFGLLLPLGIMGLFSRARGRLVLAVLVLGSLLVLNSVRYKFSWDVAKFGTVAAIALSVLGGAALARLWSAPRALPARALCLALLAAAIAPGLCHPLIFGLDLAGIPAGNFPRSAEPLSGPDVEAMTWLRTRVRPTDVVYRSIPASYGYAPWGGLPQPWIEGQTASFGFSPARLSRRRRLLTELPLQPERWLAEGIRWLVLDARDRRQNEIAERWIREGKARMAREIKAAAPMKRIQIVEILGDGATAR